MIGIDSNVLVRFLVKADTAQATSAVSAFARLTASEPGYLTTVVLVETYWVLRRAYKLNSEDVLKALAAVIATDEILVQDAPVAIAAIDAANGGADFADAIVAGACAARGCRTVLSFDEGAQAALGFVAPQ